MENVFKQGKVVVLSLLFSALSLSAQDSRVKAVDDYGNPMCTIYPEEPLVFVFETDTLFISAAADSTHTGAYLYSLYAYINGSIIVSNYTMVVVFENNSSIHLSPSKSDWNEGYFEYELSDAYVWLLRTSIITGFIVYSNEEAYSCVIIHNQLYLRDFLKRHRP